MSSKRFAPVIAGIGEAGYSWASGQSETALAVKAVRTALDDAGLRPADLDGLVRFSVDTARQSDVARALGVRDLRLALDCASGPAAAVGMLAIAVAAIQAGQARAVACYRAFNGRSMLRLGHLPLPPVSSEGHVLATGPMPFGGEFTGPYGVVSPACVFPLWVRTYLARHALPEQRFVEALCEVVVRQRRYATANPRALLRDKPLDGEGYYASPIVAEPLRRADYCLETDGACAFIVTGEGLAGEAPVRVLGTAQSLSLHYENFFYDAPELPPRQDRTLLAGLLARAGLTHADVDLLGLYDACSANVLFDLESLGFCAQGEGPACLLSGACPPINTSGGMLAEIYLQGMNQLIELVRQLRGQSVNQVPGARIGVAAGAAVQSVALLGAQVAA